MSQVPDQGTESGLAFRLVFQRGQWHVHADRWLILQRMLLFQLQQLRRLAAEAAFTSSCRRRRMLFRKRNDQDAFRASSYR